MKCKHCGKELTKANDSKDSAYFHSINGWVGCTREWNTTAEPEDDGE